MSFTEKLSRGWFISKTSLRFALNHKQTLAFALLPIPFFIVTGLFFIFFSIIVHIVTSMITHTDSSKLLFVVCGALCLWTLSAISLFFKSALSNYTAHTIQHETATVSGSLKAILPRLNVIIKFAGLSTLLGIVLRVLQNNKKSNKASMVTSLASSALGTTLQVGWGILTLFMIPIIALEKTNTIDSLKLSGNTFKKTWGESAAGSFSLFGIKFLAALVYGVGVWIVASLLTLLIGPALTSILITMAILLFVLVMSTISGIFQTVLYLYATGGVTGPFDKKFLAGNSNAQQD